MVQDTPTQASGFSPTGQITFRLYRPGDTTCSQPPLFHSVKTVSGNDGYVSSNYTATKPGVYRWRASYSGDAANNPVAGACGDPNESVTVAKAKPKIATTASAGVVLGGKVHDTATLSGAYKPTGTLTFSLYGPGDSTCSHPPVFQASKTVSGNGAYRSADFVPKATGGYRWRASYTGDARNKAVTAACNVPGESVTVTRR
jgi:hypothetical protein